MKTKTSPAQLDREIAEVLSGWGVGGKAPLTEARVVKLTDDHINPLYQDAMARGDAKTAKLAAKAAYAYDKPREKIGALAAHVAGKKRARSSHATKKPAAKQKRYRLVIAGPTGRYTERELTATKAKALAEARRELEYGAVYVRVDTDVDPLHRTYTQVTELRK